MSSTTLRTSREGDVVRLSLARPEKRNAFNEELVAGITAAAADVVRDDTVRVVILDGDGPTFCAGADIAWMRHLGGLGEEANRASAERLAAMFNALDRLPRPLVGRVHGACLGGGMGLAAVCDVVVATAGCIFAASEVRLGILPAVIGPHLVRRLGFGACRELMLTGRRLGAAEAAGLGLVHHVVSGAAPDALDEKVREVVADLLRGGPLAQRHIKDFLHTLVEWRDPRERLAAWTAGEITRARSTAEAQSGLEAFLRRETPPWVPDDQSSAG